jgi:hypothetical protein
LSDGVEASLSPLWWQSYHSDRKDSPRTCTHPLSCMSHSVLEGGDLGLRLLSLPLHRPFAWDQPSCSDLGFILFYFASFSVLFLPYHSFSDHFQHMKLTYTRGNVFIKLKPHLVQFHISRIHSQEGFQWFPQPHTGEGSEGLPSHMVTQRPQEEPGQTW